MSQQNETRCCGGSGIRRVAHGAKGLVKALVGADQADLKLMSLRTLICRGSEQKGIPRCDQAAAGLFCRACGCVIAAKIRVAAERCPLGKW